MKRYQPLHGCFVTGTDTGVGKTRISAGLLHWCARQGWRSAGLKPVAAGTELVDGERVNEDVRSLRAASSLALTDAEVCPYQFDVACAPHIAATLEGRTIDNLTLLEAANDLADRSDVLVVEGVGGFCVPLNSQWDTSHLACALSLPVVLVIGMRLGCLNHALLTAEAIRARFLKLAGWVANVMDPDMPHIQGNLACLQHELWHRHRAPCLGLVPWLPHPDAAAVAAQLDEAALRALFAQPRFFWKDPR